METLSTIVCPVCTLYLRPGITLETHLTSHPKQKVIEALIKLSQLGSPNVEKILESECLSNDSTLSQLNGGNFSHYQTPLNFGQVSPNVNQISSTNTDASNQLVSTSVSPNIGQIPANHSFFYQQFMSSSGTQPVLNFNTIAQPLVAVPTVFNPQMFCSPYVFQQQQQLHIVSSGTNMQPLVQKSNNEDITNSFSEVSPSTSAINESVSENVLKTNPQENCSKSVEKGTNEENKDECLNNDGQDLMKTETVKNSDIQRDNSNIYQQSSTNCTDAIKIIPMTQIPRDAIEIIPLIQKTVGNDENLCNETQTERINNGIIIMKIPQSDEDIAKTDSENQFVENDDDLDKACQTNTNEESSVVMKETVENIDKDNETNLQTDLKNPANSKTNLSKQINLEKNNPAFFMLDSNVKDKLCLPLNNGMVISNSENITLLEIDSLNLMLPNDLVQSGQSVISKVENFECINDANRGRPQILMNIGIPKPNVEVTNLDKKEHIDKLDESVSQDSLNIHADERMPPRGELSEQESNGASDIAWGRVYQEGSSGMSTSYDLLARESWEASDCSDSEIPPLQSRIPPSGCYSPDLDTDAVMTLSKKSPSLNFSCSTCGETFSCPKERRVHQTQEHSASSNSGFSQTSSKAKLTKSKKNMEVKKENNFEMFAKSEPKVEMQNEKSDQALQITEMDAKGAIKENVLCNVCGELLSTMKELSIHLKNAHKIWSGQRHQCKTCFEEFPSDAKYTEHLRVHPLECSLCAKVFYRRVNFQLHMKRHWGVRPYKCDTCSKAFLTKQKLMEHQNVHTGNSPIKCSLCDETFRRHSNLVQHRNRHHLNIKKKVKDYICHCGEIYHSKNKFTWHKETHDPKPKSCMYCQEKFVHMSSLTRHIRRAHNQRYVPEEKRDSENVECHICKGVYLKSSLDIHMLTHSNNKQHSCLICGKEFTTKWNLKLHRWTHASRTSKPFKCDLCNGAFIRHTDYVAHMNSHKRVRPYTCNYCGCKFIRKYNCQRHVREHEEGKSYTCTACNKSFHRSYYLKEHMRVHSGARPFACHICGKTSTTKSNHNKHMKIHHAREPVSTEG